MIKILNFGFHSPNSSLNIVQRNGKKIVLAMVINIETVSERIGEMTADTPVSFGIEEVPLKAVQKLMADSEDIGAMIAIENGKSLSGDILKALQGFVRRSVGTVAVSELAKA